MTTLAGVFTCTFTENEARAFATFQISMVARPKRGWHMQPPAKPLSHPSPQQTSIMFSTQRGHRQYYHSLSHPSMTVTDGQRFGPQHIGNCTFTLLTKNTFRLSQQPETICSTHRGHQQDSPVGRRTDGFAATRCSRCLQLHVMMGLLCCWARCKGL